MPPFKSFPSTAPLTKRSPGLDLLRALAIIWVLLFHGITEGIGTPIQFLGRAGWMAVDLFFVLSGYLIASQLFLSLRRAEPRLLVTFYIRRAFRILPVYLAIVALYFSFPEAREAAGIQPWWQFLTFTENLLGDFHRNRAFSHAWSLCVEEHFYLLFPLLAGGLFRLRSPTTVVGVFLLIFAGGVALRYYRWVHTLENGEILQGEPWLFLEYIYYPTTTRLDGLLAGVALAAVKVFHPPQWSAMARKPVTLFATAVGITSLAIWVASSRTTLAAVVLGFPLLAAGLALLVASAASEQGVLGRLRVPGAQSLATITFSLYLTHKMVWHLLRANAGALVATKGPQSFMVYAAGAICAATGFYWFIERPFLKLRGRLELSRARLSISSGQKY